MQFNSRTNEIYISSDGQTLIDYNTYVAAEGSAALLNETRSFMVDDLVRPIFSVSSEHSNPDVDMFFSPEVHNPITYVRGMMFHKSFLFLTTPGGSNYPRATWTQLLSASAPHLNLHHLISYEKRVYLALNTQVRSLTTAAGVTYNAFSEKMGKGVYGALSYFKQLIQQYWDTYYQMINTLVLSKLFPRFNIMEVDAVNRAIIKYRELGYFQFKLLGGVTFASFIGRTEIQWWSGQEISCDNGHNIEKVGQSVMFGLFCQAYSCFQTMSAMNSAFDIETMMSNPNPPSHYRGSISNLFMREYGCPSRRVAPNPEEDVSRVREEED